MRKLSFFSKKSGSALSLQKLSGLLVPLVTPLNSDFSVDEVSLKNLVARLMNKGVHGFFVFSRFSEYEKLSHSDRQKVLHTVGAELSGKGVLISGCFASAAEEIISLVNDSSRYADACVVNVPVSALTNALEFADFFELLMSKTRAKIILYNNPSLFGQSIPLERLGNFINWENLAGIIDASRNPDYFEELSKSFSATRLFEENEELAFEALRLGFSGLSCFSSVLFPSYYLQLIENFEGLDYRRLMRNEAKVSALNKLILPAKRVQAVKHVLSLQGIIQPFYFDSLEPLSDKEKYIIEEMLGLYRKPKEASASFGSNIP